MEIVKKFLPEMESLIDGTAKPSQIDVLCDLMALRIGGLPGYRRVLLGLYGQVDRFILRQVQEPFSALVAMRKRADDAPEDLKELWVSQNLDLIKSIDSQTMEKIKGVLQRGVIDTQERARLTKDLISEIEHIAGVERSRAILIGTDQIGKLNGRLMEHRQRGVGIESYIWRSSGDRRVRELHKAHNRQTYSWDEPPLDGHPGQPIRCRCVADPVMDIDAMFGLPKGWTKVGSNTSPAVTKAVPKAVEPDNVVNGVAFSDSFVGALGQKRMKEVAGIVNKAPKPYQKVWSKYAGRCEIKDAKSNAAYFSPSEDGIWLNVEKTATDGKGYKSQYGTLFHETAHQIASLIARELGGSRFEDVSLLWRSKSGLTLNECLLKEGKAYIAKAKKERQKQSDVYARIEQELWDLYRNNPKSCTVSDIWQGVTKSRVNGPVGHKKKYWKRQDVGVEAFAEMFECAMTNPAGLEQIKKYFPQSFKLFEELIEAWGRANDRV